MFGIRGEGETKESFVTSFTAERPDKQQRQDHLFHNPFTP
jgi:hypothetical protein